MINTIAKTYFKARRKKIDLLYNHWNERQNYWLNYILNQGQYCQYCQYYNIQNTHSYTEFQQNFPVCNYEMLRPYIERNMNGEQQILWNSNIYEFAKSSGTTSTKSKYLPVSKEVLKYNHYKSAMDILSLYIHLFPDTKIFKGKSLALGGSFKKYIQNQPIICGDISAILLKNAPIFADIIRVPSKKIALMSDWNEKLQQLCWTTKNADITNLSGIPSWFLILCKEIMKAKNTQNLDEVWPHLEVFFHGGVNFAPYQEQYLQMFKNHHINFINTYNASEGFFGIQDQKDIEDLLLLTDNGIFYEFIEMTDFESNNKKTIPLCDIKLNVNYAMVITTCSGLWRYIISDTVRFSSIQPPRFQITGRTNAFINAFGEELIIDNAEKGLVKACKETGAMIHEYTAAPIYLSQKNKSGSHQWLIEFEKEPDSLTHFSQVLDIELKKLNSDYEAKRSSNLILDSPQIISLPHNTFLKWLSENNRLGGQYKVPRLKNDRSIAEQLLKYISE